MNTQLSLGTAKDDESAPVENYCPYKFFHDTVPLPTQSYVAGENYPTDCSLFWFLILFCECFDSMI